MITDRIFELREIGDNKAILKSREEELATPLLKDKTKLKDIYEIVKSECLNNKSMSKYEVKYYFVAIASFLYTPKAWMGESFERGVRGEIADILGCGASYISNIFRDVTTLYEVYSSFRRGVEYLYDRIVDELT